MEASWGADSWFRRESLIGPGTEQGLRGVDCPQRRLFSHARASSTQLEGRLK